MPYEGAPEQRHVCNVTELCRPSSGAGLGRRRRQAQPSFDLNELLNNPINGQVDFNGGLGNRADGHFNVRYDPSTGLVASGAPAYGNCPNCLPPGGAQSDGRFFDTTRPYDSSANGRFTVDNPNYKFLPDGYNRQYLASSSNSRFYDPSGSAAAQGLSSSTTAPLLSNAEQNRLNYDEIRTSAGNAASGQRFTNNIYGYDYRSSPGTRYTINGNIDVQTSPSSSGDESMYQPPEVQRRPARQAQSSLAGTAYRNQDLKFPREENTIPMADLPQRDQPGQQGRGALGDYDIVDGTAMYYPYRTSTAQGGAAGPALQYPAQARDEPQVLDLAQWNREHGDQVQYTSNDAFATSADAVVRQYDGRAPGRGRVFRPRLHRHRPLLVSGVRDQAGPDAGRRRGVAGRSDGLSNVLPAAEALAAPGGPPLLPGPEGGRLLSAVASAYLHCGSARGAAPCTVPARK